MKIAAACNQQSVVFGKVNELEYPVHHGVAQGNQGINAANRKAGRR